MTISLRSDPSGTSGALQVNGTDIVTVSSTGTSPAAGKSIEATSGPNGSAFGFRNKIINGKMEIAQRGTSFPAIAGGAFSADRWRLGNITSAVMTASQQSDAPSNNEFQSSLRFAVTTADTSIASGDLAQIIHPLEGYTVRDLIGRTFTLSFWVRSSKTGTHCVGMTNSVDRSYVTEYTINAANTWEQKSVTVSGGLITAGTWNWTTGLGLSLGFVLASGSTFHTTAGAWQTGVFVATANQVNCLDTIGNIFAITGVQLEAGSVATPFEHRPYGTELALCQRYCWIARGTAVANGFTYIGTGLCIGNSNVVVPIPKMRGIPSVTFGGTVTLSDGSVYLSVASIGAVYDGWVGLNATNATLTIGRAATVSTQNTANDFLLVTSEL